MRVIFAFIITGMSAAIAHADEQRPLAWQLMPPTITYHAGDRVDASQNASLNNRGQSGPGFGPYISVEAKDIPIQRVDEVLRPLMEARIRAYQKAVDEAVNFIQEPIKQP